jgi:hypothetical protein
MMSSRQAVQVVFPYASMIVIATAFVTVFTDVTVKYKIVNQAPIGAPMNPTNGGNAKSVALLSAAILLGVFGN